MGLTVGSNRATIDQMPIAAPPFVQPIVVVPCGVKSCPANRELFCSVPSAIHIDARGVCKTGRHFIVTAPKVTRSALQRVH